MKDKKYFAVLEDMFGRLFILNTNEPKSKVSKWSNCFGVFNSITEAKFKAHGILNARIKNINRNRSSLKKYIKS